jgi:hypothetical protein
MESDEGEQEAMGERLRGMECLVSALEGTSVPGEEVGHTGMHACHAQNTRHPLSHSSKHVAGNRVTDVGANFGPFSG